MSAPPLLPPGASAGLERFNLRHMRYFLAVAEAGSFRAASARLNVAQSAVSRRVADLELIFGVRLFDRHARGAVLSEAGTMLRQGAARISREIDQIHDTLSGYSLGDAEVVRVGLFGTTSQLAFVPKLIARLREDVPEIRLDLETLPFGAFDDASLAPLDLAFHENARALPGTRTEVLLDGRYMAALPRGHALSALAEIPFRELCNAEILCFPYLANPPAHDALIRAAAARGQSLSIIHETVSECARLALAAAGMGIAIVSPLAARHDQQFEVDYRPIADVQLPFQLCLATRAAMTPAISRFAAITQAVLTSMS